MSGCQAEPSSLRVPHISNHSCLPSSSNDMSTPSTTESRAYIVPSATSPLEPGVIQRRGVLADDVSIKIHYCGICHSDLHMARNEFGMSQYPVVPGHEIVGVVDAVGSAVTKFKVGQRVGVGCYVASCKSCDRCKGDEVSYCKEGTLTYNAADKIGNLGTTKGGYSERIVVSEDYVLSIPDNLDFVGSAPLLCAGITVYNPLMTAKIGPGKSVGVLGVGGLGHMGIQLAHALGARVVALTRVASKRDELLKLGADDVLITSDTEALQSASDSLDLIIDTVSAPHDVSFVWNILRYAGTYHLVGASPAPVSVPPFPVLFKKLIVTASIIGGLKQTQEMLDFCGKHDIIAQTELTPLAKVNEAYERLEKGDVRYRFVLDIIGAYGQ